MTKVVSMEENPDFDQEMESLVNRDPNKLNEHVQVCFTAGRPCKIMIICGQVMWEDVFGEPQGVRSIDFAWNCSIACYDQ